MRLASMTAIVKTQKPIKWVWKQYIPASNITILAAKGGVGKSAFALWLAGELAKEKKHTIYIDYEKTALHMGQRYKDWNFSNLGYDEYIHFPVFEDPDTNELIPDSPSIIDITHDVLTLPADLVIIDSMTPFFEYYDLKDRGGTTAFFGTLQSLAVKTNCGVLMLAHVNKDPLPNMKIKDFMPDSIAGSSAIRDLSKSVLGMMPDSKNLNCRIIQHVKHNITKKQPDIMFELNEYSMPVNFSFKEKDIQIAHPDETTTVFGRLTMAMKIAIIENPELTKKELRQIIKDNPEGNDDYATKVYNQLVKEGIILT